MTSSTPTLTAPWIPYAGFGWRSAESLILGHLPPCLVSDDEKVALFDFARQLPASWYWGMFEVRLQADSGRTDLLAALLQSPLTRREIHDTFAAGGHPALDSARGTLTAWTSHDGTEFARSPNLWFEWDHDRPQAPALQWLCLAPEFFDKTQSKPTIPQLISLSCQFMKSAPDLHVKGAARTLERLAAALPKSGKLMSFSSLKPRGREVCRVFARVPKGTLTDWLRTVNWPGDFGKLAGVLPSFEVDGEDHFCQLEFGEKVGPYLGLELAQTERGFPRRKAREDWLKWAVREGWASEEKAQAVLNWHGRAPCTLPQAPPVQLLRSFHLKLALFPDRDPEAKAYLGFYFRKLSQALAA